MLVPADAAGGEIGIVLSDSACMRSTITDRSYSANAPTYGQVRHRLLFVDALRDRDKADPERIENLNVRDQIEERAAEPVEFPDQDRVKLAPLRIGDKPLLHGAFRAAFA